MENLPEAIWIRERIARKNHVCCECGKIIFAGDKYRFTSGIWDREPHSFKQCHRCASIMDIAASLSHFPEEGPYFTGLYEWLDETGQRQYVMEALKESQDNE